MESGGQALKDILERVTLKQIEEAGVIETRTNELLAKVLGEVEENDDLRNFEYAYHGTRRVNLPDIA